MSASSPHFFRRAGRWLYEQRLRVPLTPLGLGLGLLAFWIYRRFANEEADFVLYAAALVALLLLAVAVAGVLLVTGLLWLRLRGERGLEDLRLESGVPAATGFSFPRFGIWPLVQVRLEWADPPSVEASMEKTGGRVQEVVVPGQRGERMAVRRRFIVGDIFGLARLGLHRRAAQRVRILPGRARVSGHVISSFVGGEGLSHPSGPLDGELLDMRRYAHGDPLRHVLWKAFARTRQLLVRTPERAIAPSPSMMAYFVAGADDEASAAAARFFLEQGLLGDDFTFGADGSSEPTGDVGEAIEQLIKSVQARDEGGVGLGRFLERAERARQRSLLLFLPPVPGPWLAQLGHHAVRLRGATAICAIDGGLGPGSRSRVRRLLFADPARAERRSASALPTVLARLRELGLDTRVLHRPSGELIATATILQGAASR